MKITCWGARGSIPVSGKEYLRYGGDTTCLEIRTNEDEILIIDAGSGIRKLGQKLAKESRKEITILFTHFHLDHVMGLPFFEPLYKKDFKINIIGRPFIDASVKEMITKSMSPPSFPITIDDVPARVDFKSLSDEKIHSSSVHVSTMPLSHPDKGVGYKFEEGKARFVMLTDNELGYAHPGAAKYEEYVEFCSGVDMLIHDAEFLPEEYENKKTRGHSSFTDVLKLALDAKVARFGIFHHNQDRTDDAIDNMVTSCREKIQNAGATLDCFALYSGMEITI